MRVEKAEFRQALGHFAAGVTVVTLKTEQGELAGITVTAFSSLSLEPPLVLVCIDKRARLHDRFQKGSFFAVNLLAENQELVSRRFASREPEPFKETGYHEGSTGAPLIPDTLSAIECRTVDLLAGGDHTIVVGEVEATRIGEGRPLLYFRGGYGQLT